MRASGDTESVLAKTPEHQAAQALDAAAGELETLRQQALDFATVLQDRIRSIRATARDQRARAFDRCAPSQDHPHA